MNISGDAVGSQAESRFVTHWFTPRFWKVFGLFDFEDSLVWSLKTAVHRGLPIVPVCGPESPVGIRPCIPLNSPPAFHRQ